jgi:O-antigen ligase
VSNIVEETVWLRWIAWLIIGLGTATSILYQTPLSIKKIFNVRGIFPTWIIALTYAFFLYHEKLRPWQRFGLLGICGAWLWWQLGQGFLWMSGWAPALVAVVVISWQRSKKLFLLLVVLGLIFVGANFDKLYYKVVVESEQEGDFQRLELWRTNLELVGNHPIFGTGPAGYAVYYMSYHPENARSTHNNYFDIIAQTGLAGFLAYLWFWAALAYTSYELSQKLSQQRDFESAYAAAMLGGCLAAIASGMLGDWIIPFAYNQTIEGFDHSIYTWTLLGGMVSLWHIVKARTAQNGTTGEQHLYDRATTQS